MAVIGKTITMLNGGRRAPNQSLSSMSLTHMASSPASSGCAKASRRFSTTLSNILALLTVLCLTTSGCRERDKNTHDPQRLPVTQTEVSAVAGGGNDSAGGPTERARTYVLKDNRNETLYLYFGINQSGPRFPCRSLGFVQQIAKGQEWQVTIPPGNWGLIWLTTVQNPCDKDHSRWIYGARPALAGQSTSVLLEVQEGRPWRQSSLGRCLMNLAGSLFRFLL